jgi:site-specific DNA-methyltransferase (adenine-specific)/modification methylase
MSQINLYNGDCLDVMQQMIDNNEKVDCIITSPPYNMCLRIHSGKYMSRWGWKGNVGSFSAKYEGYKDDLPMDEYFKFQDEFISKALQVTDLMFYNIQMITGNKVALLQLMGKYAEKIKEIIIWNKGYGQPAMQNGVLNSQYEFIIVFQNSKPYNRSFEKALFPRGTETNVWDIKRERNNLIKAGFPQELVKRILKNFVKDGSIILDPYMGSGTTGIVCKELGYDFIGVELDKEMFDKAKERINESN